MVRKRFRYLADACEVARPIRLAFIAITVVAGLVAFQGWVISASVLAGVLVLVAGLMVFEVHRGMSHLHRQSNMVRKAAGEAEKHYVQVLWRIVRVIESRDRYTEGHSERVAELSEQMAQEMGLSDKKCADLKVAARLHDLGMLAVSERIFRGQDRFGVESFRSVQMHPEVAHEILKPLQSLTKALPGIRYHHERMNGTGYPKGLKGEEIPLEARILAVADAYDAMTHDRPYRVAMTPLMAMNELQRCTPAGYDPACVDVLGELKHLPKLEETLVRT